MGEKRGKYRPKEDNIRKLFAFLSKEEQKTPKEVIIKDTHQKEINDLRQ
jgi:hypothetical protein